MNWQEQLLAFRQANPDLPEGTEPPQPSADDIRADMIASQPRLDVRMERKGRAGKTATIVAGWVIDADEVARVASTLKQRLGVGGSATADHILIQGDRRDQVVDQLKALGFKARRI